MTPTLANPTRLRTAVAAVAATAVTSVGLAGLAAGPASAAETLTCGSVVTKSVVLQADLTGCPGNGLVVGASGITIDLNGHRISGNNTNPDANPGGITRVGNTEVTQVTIKNGRIENFSYGVNLEYTYSSTVTGLRLTGNYTGMRLAFTKVKVSGNTITGSGSSGVDVGAGEGNVVELNTVTGFGLGIVVGSQAPATLVASNAVSSSIGDGIRTWAQQTTVTGNKVAASGEAGIATEPGATGSITGNTASHNKGQGIAVNWTSGTLVVANNTANYNHLEGIWVWSGGHDGGGNHATGNGSTPQCVNVVCS